MLLGIGLVVFLYWLEVIGVEDVAVRASRSRSEDSAMGFPESYWKNQN